MKGTKVWQVLRMLSLIGEKWDRCLEFLEFYVSLCFQDQGNLVTGKTMANKKLHSAEHRETFC